MSLLVNHDHLDILFLKENSSSENLNAAPLIQDVYISDLFSKYFSQYLAHFKTTILTEAAAILEILSSTSGNAAKMKNKFLSCTKTYKNSYLY